MVKPHIVKPLFHSKLGMPIGNGTTLLTPPIALSRFARCHPIVAAAAARAATFRNCAVNRLHRLCPLL